MALMTVSKILASPEGALTPQALERFQRAFESEPRYVASMNAACAAPPGKLVLNRRRLVQFNNSYSIHLPENKATSQKASGRCWLFAGLNTLRRAAIKNLNVGEDFEISQSHLAFWDKFEKANYFLESILLTLDEPTDGRLVSFLMQNPVQDGGQWDMFVNLVRKYGCVPKSVQPETEGSSSTGAVTTLVTRKLREFAAELRRMHSQGADLEALRRRKQAMLEEVYRILVIHYGEPTRRFWWQWRDKDKGFHRDGWMTPLEFFRRYVQADLDEQVCLIHCPQESKEMHRLYTVRFLGNVVGGDIIRYINVPIEVLKNAAVAQLKDGCAVWFGCDVGKNFDGEVGWMDLEIHDFQSFYGTTVRMTKAERLDYGDTAMNHAMVFTGVDLDDEGRPRQWRVENSWGDERADKGYYAMSDAWFDEHMFEVVVAKKHLPADVLAVLDQEPIELEPWDPMGSLAVAD